MKKSTTLSSTFPILLHGREFKKGAFYVAVSPDGRRADINHGESRKPLLLLQSPEEAKDALQVFKILAGKDRP